MNIPYSVIPGLLPPLLAFLLPGAVAMSAPECDFVEREIAVDGELADWTGVVPNVVRGREHLWFGQGMTPERWLGDSDLSYQWRGAWSGDRLYFAIEVKDDRVVAPSQPSSFLCDCVEIYLDYNNKGGRRVKVLDGRDDWYARCDPSELMGYELHFLAESKPRVYLDHADRYLLDKPQTDRFQSDWGGAVAFHPTTSGYVMEIGFHVPHVAIQAGKRIGIEIGVCDDDDDAGRESIMMWTGTKSDFWLTMDDYGEVTIRTALERGRPPAESPAPRSDP